MSAAHAPRSDRDLSSPPTGWADRGANYFGLNNSGEFVAAAALCAILIVFRLVNVVTWKFDTDESQHTHVIWGWARGFVEYRDLCDNHMPLFHLLFAPIYDLIGDRPTILIWMRLLLFPAYLAAAWGTYRIGSLLFSRRVGLWSAIMVGFYPGYYFLSGEFRTDNLWAPLWILSLLILLAHAPTLGRSLAAGLLLGCCFGISMKTSLLFVSVLVAAGLTLFLFREQRRASLGYLASCFFVFVLCAAAVPLSIMFGFARAGLWPQFRYWVFENNLLPGLTNHPAWWKLLFPVFFPVAVFAVGRWSGTVRDRVAAARRSFLLLICAFYLLALWSYWNLVTRQDYLPFHPIAFIFYTAIILWAAERAPALRRSQFFRRLPLPALIASTEFVVAFFARPVWENSGKAQTDLLRATAQLTNPGDFVLDLKGETVFRQRAFAPIWEPLVMERIRRGMIVDNAAQRCVETRACVATKHKDMSTDAARFIDQNYLSIGSGLYVCGAFLTPVPDHPREFAFDVVIPVAYKIIARDETVTGKLDGVPYSGARELNPGRHTFTADVVMPELAVLWAQAVDRHFTPFH